MKMQGAQSEEIEEFKKIWQQGESSWRGAQMASSAVRIIPSVFLLVGNIPCLLTYLFMYVKENNG